MTEQTKNRDIFTYPFTWMVLSSLVGFVLGGLFWTWHSIHAWEVFNIIDSMPWLTKWILCG